MPMEPDVTILIPVRNGENYIAEAIESVLRQTYSNFTLIVRNNLSKDGTSAVVSRYLSDPRVQLVEGKEDLTMAGNYNACLDLVRTKYYMILCHDDYLYRPEAIEAGYKVMEANPAVPSVFADMIYVDANSTAIANRPFNRSGLLDSMSLARQSILSSRNQFGIPLLSRSLAMKNVRICEDLPYIVDLDLAVGTTKGSQVYHLPQTLLANRWHAENGTWGLLWRVVKDMKVLARRHQIPLSAMDKVQMNLTAFYTNVAKQAFIAYEIGAAPFSRAERVPTAHAKTTR